MTKKYHVQDHPYVYIVLEHASGIKDSKVHGVYTTKEVAQGKVDKIKKKGVPDGEGGLGYLAILKKHVDGQLPRVINQGPSRYGSAHWISVDTRTSNKKETITK